MSPAPSGPNAALRQAGRRRNRPPASSLRTTTERCPWQEGWNDMGLGAFSLGYLRDKEKREVDFLVARDGEPWFLAEVKHRDESSSPSLRRYQDQVGAPFAFRARVSSDRTSVSRRITDRRATVAGRGCEQAVRCLRPARRRRRDREEIPPPRHAARSGRGSPAGYPGLAGRSVKHHMVEVYNTCTPGGWRVRAPLPKVSIELARTTDHGGLHIAW